MYLKEIKTVGFKSFASKVNISLDRGITGIVGPNGSGKSNVVDAIRFVLGEQSVKSLRGAESMSDVIFSGSKSRSALNYASVTLVFDNTDFHLACEYTEVSVKRCIYRNLENEYYLNGDKCRLKDITDLFIDSGMGKSSFNIISQGSVGEIINQKASERRVIFEDAAGVLKYKKRKEESIRRLDKTKQNLDRINDIVVELERQVVPLKEQAKLAKQYLEAKENLENVELGLIVYDITNLNYDSNNLKKQIDDLNNQIFLTEGKYGSLYNAFQNKKKIFIEKEEELKNNNALLLETTVKTEKLNSNRQLIVEQNKVNKNRTIDEEKIVSLVDEKYKLNAYVATLKNEKKLLEEKIKINNDCLNQEDSLLNQERNKKINLDMLISNKLKEEISLKYNIDMIRNSIDNNSKIFSSVKSVLDNPRLDGICDIVSNVFETVEKYHIAIQTSISSMLQVVITENEKSAKEAINYLKNNKLGRVTFFPLNVIKGKKIDDGTKEILNNNAIKYFSLVELVKFDPKYENVMQNLLGNIILVDDIDVANKVSKLINYRYRIVTLDGEIINVGGSITGGVSNNNKNNLISQKFELEEKIRTSYILDKEIKKIEEDLNEVYYIMNEIENKKTIYRNVLNDCKELLNSKTRLILEQESILNQLEINLSSLTGVNDNSLDELENDALEKYYDSVKEVENLKLLVDKLSLEKESLNNEIEVLENEIKDSNGLIVKLNKELKEYEVNVSKIDIKLDNLLTRLNVDYTITYEKAVTIYSLDVEVSLARIEVDRLKKVIKEIGMVNLNAIEEYEEISERYEFLNDQSNELIQAKEELMLIINDMDNMMKSRFEEVFNQINEEFNIVFSQLFNGGTASLKLTDKNNILESGIDIVASPPGKKLQYLSLLSGGEKTLTAIALLFSILNTRPVPFCVLDEIEAALDDVNVDNFGQYISDYKEKTQFILITHKKKTMEYVDNLYGITMQESGVSKLVSVILNDIK